MIYCILLLWYRYWRVDWRGVVYSRHPSIPSVYQTSHCWARLYSV